jgi:alkylation response protein AidB-like acyl-CoA dehydrogenase
MDLSLTSEQRLLVREARAFLADACAIGHVRTMERDARGFSRDLLREMGRLGWLGVAVPEDVGGSGQTLLEAVLLLEEMGRVLLPSPYLETAVVAAPLVLALGTDEQRRRWLPPLAAGEAVATLALVEPGWRDETGEIAVAATRAPGGAFRIRGTKTLVPFAADADLTLVAVRTGEGRGAAGGDARSADTSIVTVERGAPGVRFRRRTTLGGEPRYDIDFTDTSVPAEAFLGGPKAPGAGAAGATEGGAAAAGVVEAAVAAACAHAAVGSLAYMVGAAERVLELTVDHAKTRVQFGRPIGSFQAVAHRCADMRSDIDALRLLVYQAAWALARSQSADGASLEVSAAKAYGNEALRRIFMHAHQVFGAIGFSTEHDLHLFTRQAKAAELQWGSASTHRERVAAAMGL